MRLLILLLSVFVVAAQRDLVLPHARRCARRSKHFTWTDPRGVTHNYFFSWQHRSTRRLELDWLDSRNVCRKHCMDSVSIETPEENEMIKKFISDAQVKYVWTSGRKCNFEGCEREDLKPILRKGWFWSGSGATIGDTQDRSTGGWSNTGGAQRPQPDNREQLDENGEDEACLGILNNFYQDGVVWHDISCGHLKPFICEDSDELIGFVRSRNPQLNL